jgi:hypothetical protein
MTNKITYTPRGRGFEVRLHTDQSGDLTVRGSGLEDQEPTVEGNAELKGNVALLASTLTYAVNELAYRRSRSPEKRKSHRKAADCNAKEAVAIAVLVGLLDDEQVDGWCSGCFERSTHLHVRGHDRPYRKYLCASCGTPTTTCAVPRCRHLAMVDPRALLTLCYCAQHTHAIAGFEKATARLSDLTEVKEWLDFESRNAARVTKVGGGVLAGATVLAPMAFLAAPAVGAALGGSFLGGGLTGAAATSHGLAMLGGGAVAAGGFGMAGGTVAVTVVGTALGGRLGAGLVTAYTGSDDSFRIERLRPGTGSPVLVASGFLTKGDEGWASWQPILDARFPNSPVYRVHWGAKELKDLAALIGSGSAKVGARAALAAAAKKGSKSFGKLPGLGAVFAAADIAANPWNVAKNRAGMTGAVVADLLARTDEGPFILVGHSLGARVMVTAAQTLATRPGAPLLDSLHLLGAAVGRRGDWRTLNDAVSGRVWNYHSTNDQVLRWLYTLGDFGQQAVGHGGFGTKFPKIKDRDVSRSVAGHSAYFTGVTLEGQEHPH